jgi:hypothetical protein
MSDNRGTPEPVGAGIFTVADLKRRMTEREAAKAAEEVRRMQVQEEQQKAVMAEFQKPPERTAEQLLQLIMQLVSGAADRGQTEVQVSRRSPSGSVRECFVSSRCRRRPNAKRHRCMRSATFRISLQAARS